MNYAEMARQGQRILRENASNCRGIDREFEGRRTGAKFEAPVRYIPPTIHDLAAQNPLIRALLLKTQLKYYPSY